jgi:hypothetical protein
MREQRTSIPPARGKQTDTPCSEEEPSGGTRLPPPATARAPPYTLGRSCVMDLTIIDTLCLLIMGYADRHYAGTTPTMVIVRCETDVIDAPVSCTRPFSSQ